MARDLADALRVLQRLRFAGVRVIYISQGIDSASEQAETLVAVHGLVDGLYLREMAAKIKRGLKGQLARGLATGGKTYGYKSIPIPDPNRTGEKIGCRIEIEPTEAEINPKYRGLQVWGRRRSERKPGSRAIVARPVPESEWQTRDRPDLRIIDDELWRRAQTLRQQRLRTYREFRQAGTNLLRGRPANVRTERASLFTGFLTCGVCGKSFAVVECHRHAEKLYRYFGCQFRAKNGPTSCGNRIKVRVEEAERALLAGIQAELLNPETIAYVTDQLTTALEAITNQRPAELASLTRQRETVRSKVQNLIAAIESGSASASILRALHDREAEAAHLDAQIGALSQAPDDHRLAVLPTWDGNSSKTSQGCYRTSQNAPGASSNVSACDYPSPGTRRSCGF